MNDEGDILVRKYGETIYNTISSVAAVAIDYPKGKTTTTTATQSVSACVCVCMALILSSSSCRDDQGQRTSLVLGTRCRIATLLHLQVCVRTCQGTGIGIGTQGQRQGVLVFRQQ